MSESFNEAQVRQVAHLARLNLSPERLVEFGAQLSKIVGYFDMLQELDTDDVEPTAHPLDLTDVMRNDVAQDTLAVERVLSNAPDHDGTYFRVPKVLQQEDA